MTQDARTLIEAAFADRSLLKEAAHSKAVLDTLEALDKGKLRPGTRPKKLPVGEYGTPSALIIGMRKESTDQRTSLNAALRDFGVSA